MADVAPSAPAFKKRTPKNIRKRPATPPPADSDSDGSDYTDDEQGTKVKRRKLGVKIAGQKKDTTAQDFSKSTKYAADRSTTIAANEDATKASTWYTDASLAADSAVALAKAKRQERDDNSTGDDNNASGAYKGSAQYSTFIQKNGEARGPVGPVKAPTNVRTITVTDFAPDVCKDYKQTGFCGFGDGCKFLHAREDYKQGWQLDKEWEKAGKRDSKTAKQGGEDLSGLTEEEKVLEGIPFKCIICKEDYKTPVVTKCGHYFCERCIMQRYMKEKKRTCPNCGADTGGSFGVARKLKELLEKKRKREEEKGEDAEDG